MKILITENQLRKVQFKYLDYLFDGMREIKSEDYPDSRFWEKDGKVILELKKSGNLWVLESIWDDISNMFSLKYDETQQLIKEWMEQQLKLEGVIPDVPTWYELWSMEQRLNKK
jgi:hypothetical protein